MCCDGADADLPNSGGKNGQPVQRSSTRVRKPNSSVDQEGMVLGWIRELRRQRERVLSSLTVKRREIDSLLRGETLNYKMVATDDF